MNIIKGKKMLIQICVFRHKITFYISSSLFANFYLRVMSLDSINLARFSQIRFNIIIVKLILYEILFDANYSVDGRFFFYKLRSQLPVFIS